jgi:hypothetical protein
MKLVTEKITLTTNGSGAATAFGGSHRGTLYAVQLIDGTFDDGVDITITAEHEDLSIPLLTKADFNTDQMAYPRTLQHLNTDGTALTTHCEPVVNGRLKVVIAQGGNAKTGGCIAYIRKYS